MVVVQVPWMVDVLPMDALQEATVVFFPMENEFWSLQVDIGRKQPEKRGTARILLYQVTAFQCSVGKEGPPADIKLDSFLKLP